MDLLKGLFPKLIEIIMWELSTLLLQWKHSVSIWPIATPTLCWLVQPNRLSVVGLFYSGRPNIQNHQPNSSKMNKTKKFCFPCSPKWVLSVATSPGQKNLSKLFTGLCDLPTLTSSEPPTVQPGCFHLCWSSPSRPVPCLSQLPRLLCLLDLHFTNP